MTGDVHGDPIPRLEWMLSDIMDKATPISPMRDDVVIITGDFGVIWATENSPSWLAEEEAIFEKLSKMPFTICFVDGNHENHSRLDNLPVIEMFGGKVGRVTENVFHLKRGEIYTINRETFFCFGGAMSTDKHNRIEDFSWWAREIASKEEMQYAVDNLEKHNFSVDYVIAHTFPVSIVAEILYGGMVDRNLEGRVLDPTSVFFERLVAIFELKFRIWFGGHFHVFEKLRDGKYVVLCENIVEV
jgi:DNA repair exonuclease SbcCD nuclease subunit